MNTKEKKKIREKKREDRYDVIWFQEGISELTSAKEIAPRSPANQITHCIFRLMVRFLPKFAKIERGKVLKKRPIKQNTMQITKKNRFHRLNFPVNIPIPMNKKTKNSLKTARDLKI